MERLRVIEDEVGISSPGYQMRAAACVGGFLARFRPSPKQHVSSLPDKKATPITVRTHDAPPSVQVIKKPDGGVAQGVFRIRQKFTWLRAAGITITQPEIVTAEESDLTRECIIATLQDQSLAEALERDLFDSRKIADLLIALRIGHPSFFVVMQRYIMGIEAGDAIRVPYKVVPETDRETFEYLERLPEQLVA